jgi:hypothetical protein
MPYRRRVLHYGPSPAELQGELSDRVIAGCWFELLRQGGCGRGEVTLNDDFVDRHALQVGEWIACEFDDGERWYLGRIEQRVSAWPGGITLKLMGVSAQLDGVFPGGFGLGADGRRPHRYSRSDRFYDDPDYYRETVDAVERPEDIVRLLMDEYIVPATDIQLDEELIENAAVAADVISLKFHGEDSARSILRDLATRVKGAAWGVDELGRFFFLPRRSTATATYQIGTATVRVVEIQDREQLFNRVLLTGGYEYGGGYSGSGAGGDITRRWRGNYLQPASIATYGERRIRISVPWIRTPEDSRQFVREFFRIYAAPTTRYQVHVIGETSYPRPWLGPVQLLDRNGDELIQADVEVLRVQFDHTPVLQLELGPLDPRLLWPALPDQEHYPAGYIDASDGSGGDLVSLVSESSEEGGETDVECPPCDVMPRQWRVTFAGLMNGDCDECNLLNDTFTLDLYSAEEPCFWQASHPACAGAYLAFIRLIVESEAMQLHIRAGGTTTIYTAEEPINCLSANVLSLSFTGDNCANWPATVTVEPV